MSASEDSVGPPSSDSIPSSFDGTEFFEESRTQKLWRKIKQEPLIPLGCAATCYALYQATKSIRAGNHNQTNKMFRARIYAQGFTLVALVAGSFFYKDERLQRKKFEGALEEKKATEKRDKWLRELEMRDDEERAWRTKVEDTYRKADEARQAAELAGREVKESARKAGKEVKEAVEQRFSSKSVREQVTRDGWGSGTWLLRAHDAWKRI